MRIKKKTDFIHFDGVYIPPGDKSISHRSIFFSALTEDNLRIDNFLFSEDCLRTVEAFRSLGVEINLKENNSVEVSGVGLNGFKAPSEPLYLGNSGTTTRLLMGLLSGQNFETILTGDASLSSRPMRRVTYPLRMMGAEIEGEEDANYLPIKIRGGKLRGIEYKLPQASAQVKSALLIAGMYARGKTIVIEPFKSRDHTERFIKTFGARIKIQDLRVEVSFTPRLRGKDIFIPGDISSSAYFIALCLLSKDSRLVVKDVGLNPTRLGFLRVLERMGANLEFIYKGEPSQELIEPYGDIIAYSSDLKGTQVRSEEIPALIDELPILFLLASLADGETYIQGASELRVKESDRINSMFLNLKRMGIEMEVDGDDILIKGGRNLKPANLKSFSDHRIAMVMTIAGIFAQGDSTIDSPECVKISYPDFFKDLKNILGPEVEFEN